MDGRTQLRTLIAHPMETGRNRDPDTNQPIPAHYIQELTVTLNGRVIASGALGASISKDPYFAFMLKGGKAGDKISVSWRDNLGNTDNEEHVVK